MGNGTAAVLLVSADAHTRDDCRAWLSAEGLDVHEARSATEALEFHKEHRCLLTITDARLPECNGIELLRQIRGLDAQANVALVSDPDTPGSSIAALEAGAVDCIDRPLGRPSLIDLTKMVMDRVRRAEAARQRRNLQIPELHEIVAVSSSMRAVRAAAARAALRSDPVLLLGARGAGKEVLARAMHRNGPRAARPFFVVNCAVMPAGLLDGELFGFDARSWPAGKEPHTALVKSCDGGTLFLDEVSRLAPPLQRKVLELIRTRRHEPPLGETAFDADVRVVAASREPLDGLVRSGIFDGELEEVLHGCTLQIPALADRTEDIVPLARHFLEVLEKEIGSAAPTLSREAAAYLKTRIWPGGVRELRNSLERAVIRNVSGRLGAADFRDQAPEQPGHPDAAGTQPWLLPVEGIDLEALSRTLTEQALERTRFKVSPAARLLGLSRATLRYRIRKYGLDRNAAWDPESPR